MAVNRTKLIVISSSTFEMWGGQVFSCSVKNVHVHCSNLQPVCSRVQRVQFVVCLIKIIVYSQLVDQCQGSAKHCQMADL